MLLTDEQVLSRVSSSGNLLNRLGINTDRSKEKVVPVSLPVIDLKADKKELQSVPSLPAQAAPVKTGNLTIDDLIEDVETKIQVGRAYSKSISVLNKSLDALTNRIDEAEDPTDLALIAFRMNRIISDNTKKNTDDEFLKPQVIIYKPMTINFNDLQVVQVNE